MLEARDGESAQSADPSGSFVTSAVSADSTAVGTPHATETHIVGAGIIDSGYGMNRLFRRERGDGPSRTGGKATPKAFASGRRG